jgi:hypothetical protein
MNPIFSRTLKALCTIVVAGVLTACGAGSTVDPFKPTRVIGLGDGFNDSARAIAPTVADQVAANFGLGLSSVLNTGSPTSPTAEISGLSAQIDSVIAGGGFTAGDLVVISVGTMDVQAGKDPTANTEVPELVRQIQRLLDQNVTHVLVMPILDVSRTPWGIANPSVVAAGATATFNREVLNRVGDSFGGRSTNPVIYADGSLSPISSQFLSMTDPSPLWVSPFNCFAVTTCTNGADAATSLFATSTSTYLTPDGNKWVGNLLYNATAQGWR